MQIKSLRTRSYKSWCTDTREACEAAKDRYDKIKLFDQLRAEGCSEATVLSVIGISRATLYRWKQQYRRKGMHGLTPGSKAPLKRRSSMWGPKLEAQVCKYRRRFPLWGKKTLTVVLKRELGIEVSESTIGRILSKLVKRKLIDPVCFYYGAVRPRKRRAFNQHAKRWQKGMKAKKVGQLVQLDHMTVSDTGVSIKHFEAICPITKITVSQAYNSASSLVAAAFLDLVLDALPFKVESIQVDGGSEFMKDFEQACHKKGIQLFVLPPRSPELNGCVERCNRTLRYEFYRIYDGILHMDAIREALKGYMNLYNTFRPHQALNMLTPMAYYKQLQQEASRSHMC